MGEAGKWQMLAWGVAAALVVFAGARMLSGRHAAPAAVPVRIEGEARSGSPTGARKGRDNEDLYVHVAGAVRRPGLHRLADGARVAAAVARAGGATRSADLTAVNLAQPLEDGQQVIVPQKGSRAASGSGAPGSESAPESASAPGSAAGAAGAAPRLATASAQELEQLDGIGPALAKRIIEYRQSHGGFRSLEELSEVDGIGEKRLAALRKALRP